MSTDYILLFRKKIKEYCLNNFSKKEKIFSSPIVLRKESSEEPYKVACYFNRSKTENKEIPFPHLWATMNLDGTDIQVFDMKEQPFCDESYFMDFSGDLHNENVVKEDMLSLFSEICEDILITGCFPKIKYCKYLNMAFKCVPFDARETLADLSTIAKSCYESKESYQLIKCRKCGAVFALSYSKLALSKKDERITYTCPDCEMPMAKNKADIIRNWPNPGSRPDIESIPTDAFVKALHLVSSDAFQAAYNPENDTISLSTNKTLCSEKFNDKTSFNKSFIKVKLFKGADLNLLPCEENTCQEPICILKTAAAIDVLYELDEPLFFQITKEKIKEFNAAKILEAEKLIKTAEDASLQNNSYESANEIKSSKQSETTISSDVPSTAEKENKIELSEVATKGEDIEYEMTESDNIVSPDISNCIEKEEFELSESDVPADEHIEPELPEAIIFSNVPISDEKGNDNDTMSSEAEIIVEDKYVKSEQVKTIGSLDTIFAEKEENDELHILMESGKEKSEETMPVFNFSELYRIGKYPAVGLAYRGFITHTDFLYDYLRKTGIELNDTVMEVELFDPEAINWKDIDEKLSAYSNSLFLFHVLADVENNFIYNFIRCLRIHKPYFIIDGDENVNKLIENEDFSYFITNVI